MIGLSYVSCATHHFTHDELVDLLKVCHRNNEKQGITGLLLYNGKGTFIQLLEGDEETVLNTYNAIKSDPRHKRITCISTEKITQRSFGQWKMGFRNTANINVSNVNGFSEFMEGADTSESFIHNSSMAHQLLSYFKGKSNELAF